MPVNTNLLKRKRVVLSQATLVKIADQVKGTFERVLKRDSEIVIQDLSNSNPLGFKFTHRSHQYILRLSAGSQFVNVVVSKVMRKRTYTELFEGSFEDLPKPFFVFKCQTLLLGKLRKSALILLKKVQNRDVYDVLAC